MAGERLTKTVVAVFLWCTICASQLLSWTTTCSSCFWIVYTYLNRQMPVFLRHWSTPPTSTYQEFGQHLPHSHFGLRAKIASSRLYRASNREQSNSKFAWQRFWFPDERLKHSFVINLIGTRRSSLKVLAKLTGPCTLKLFNLKWWNPDCVR